MDRIASLFLCSVLCASVGGCSDDSARDGDLDGGSDIDEEGNTDTDSDTDGDTDGCSEESKLIYTVDLDDVLYRFDPLAQEFVLVGEIDCPTGASPYALSVSRDDVVYVLYTAGADCVAINAVSALDATCYGPTDFVCGTLGFEAFGMGTATAGPGSTVDTLYIGSETALAAVDTGTWQVSPIGAVDSTPDMSGNANGELYAYFAWTSPPRVSRLDKSTAEELETMELPQLSSSGAFAFATWGGDHYLFFDGGNASTTVYRIHDGALETYMTDTGLTIVGADVSTCAPVEVE